MKKGFTLIELLGVIILLGVLALITYPIVDNAIKNSSAKALDESINNIENAAMQYGTQNNLGYDITYQTLELGILKESGYLKDEQIKNPETDQPLNGCVGYVWSESSKQYIFVYSDDCVLPTEESCFTFNSETRTITDYNSECTKDVVIPGVIGGITVETIDYDAFSWNSLTSINFDYLTGVKYIKGNAFSGNNLTYVNISKLKSIEEFSHSAFDCNNVSKKNFKGKDNYNYNYFEWRCDPR